MHISKAVAQCAGGVSRVQEQGEQLAAEEEDDDGNGQGEDHHHKQAGLQTLFYPVVLARADVLGGIAGHSVGKVHVGQHGQGVDLGGGGVAGHQHLAVGVDQSLHHHHRQGDQRLLEHGGQTDLGDAPHGGHMKQGNFLVFPSLLAGQTLHPPVHHVEGGHRAHALGDQSGPGHAGHPHVKLNDKQQIQHDVGQAGDDQENQRGFTVALGIVDAVEGVVKEEEYRSAKIDL